jgi:hypothetical protein
LGTCWELVVSRSPLLYPTFVRMSSNFHDIPFLSAEFLDRILRQCIVPDDTEVLLKQPVEPEPSTPPTKPQNRCPTCRHKLQLADMVCRCGLRYCCNHRLPETHGCTFDHKTHDRAVLETQVVRCVADKLKEDRI